MQLSILPPKSKLKIDSETLSLILETEKSLAELEALTNFLPEDYFDFLKTIDSLFNYNIDYSPVIGFDQYFLNKSNYELIGRQLSSIDTSLKILKDVKPVRLIKTLHRETLTKEDGSAGIFRENKITNTSGKIIFPQNVDELMINFEEYLLSDVSYHPFINAAIIHAQFELIHPFFSHNGIVGRNLTQLHFVWKRKLTKPMLLLSKTLIERKEEYFDKLQDIIISDGWDSWIKFMLVVFNQSARKSISLLETVHHFYRESVSASIKNNFAAPALLKVFEFIKTNPVFTIPILTSSLNLSKQTVNIIINKLLEEKIITESSGKQRYRVFTNSKLMDAISK